MLREDGFFDVLMGGASGIGNAIQAALAASSPGFLATDEWLERQYGSGGICARVVDLAAEDCWARGFTIDEDKDDFIKDYVEKLNVGIVGPTVTKWQSLYGGGAWVMFINDGSSTFKAPVNEGNIQSIDKLVAVEATSLNVFQYYDDPRNPKYGEPEIYQVKIQGFDNTRRTGTPGFGKSLAQFLVHETRVIPFPGTPLPLNLRMAKRIPWQGRSDLAAVFEDFSRLMDAQKWSVEILKKKQQAVHKFNGLSTLLVNDYNGNNETAIRKQISMADSARNALNGVTVDAEDDYTVIDLNVSGLVDLIREFKESFCSSAGYPVSVFFGRAASGISANGDNDLENYYGRVSKQQNSRIKNPLVQLVTWILKIQGAPSIPKWQIEFNPLWVPSEKDQAQAELFEGQGQQATATALTSYISEGSMSSSEVRNYLCDSHMFGLTPAQKVTDKDLLDPNSDVNDPPEPAPIVAVPGAPIPGSTTKVPT